jgi:hypothetical protein
LLGKAVNGSFVKIAHALYSNSERHLATLGAGKGATLLQRIEDVGLREQQLKPVVIQKVVDLFGDDVDWMQAARSGDSIEIMVADWPNGGCDLEAKILHAHSSVAPEDLGGHLLEVALTIRGKTRRLYGFNVGNECEFFDVDGECEKKAILRKPITMGRLRYGFGLIFHPFLRTYKFHSGVDWASSNGSPVQAVSDGVVMKVEVEAERSVVIIRNTGCSV